MLTVCCTIRPTSFSSVQFSSVRAIFFLRSLSVLFSFSDHYIQSSHYLLSSIMIFKVHFTSGPGCHGVSGLAATLPWQSRTRGLLGWRGSPCWRGGSTCAPDVAPPVPCLRPAHRMCVFGNKTYCKEWCLNF